MGHTHHIKTLNFCLIYFLSGLPLLTHSLINLAGLLTAKSPRENVEIR